MKLFKKILIGATCALSLVGIASCSNKTTLPTEQCKLTAAYSGKNFVDDGIGTATLNTATDGDTAAFTLSTATSDGTSTVRIRFFAIDTPESTGTVEKWGKAASKFTAEKLESATEIVLQGSTTPASKDSYGERYLGYVWYRTSSDEDFINLNLEIVQNGYSESKAVESSCIYYKNFVAAQDYAEKKKLHIWSNEDDPLYNDDPTDVTLKELTTDLASDTPTYYNTESESGTKVRFTAYVKSHTTTSVNYYVAEALNDDGTTSSITLYGGYSSDTINDFIRLGGLYMFIGTVQKHSGSYQVAIGGTYVALNTDNDHTHRVQKDYYLTFNSADSLYATAKETAVRSSLTVTEVTISDNVVALTATGYKKAGTDLITYTITVINPLKTSESDYLNKTLTGYGYQETVDSNIITTTGSLITLK